MRKLLFVFGTRPEAIKCAPLIKFFQADKGYKVLVCVTGQHRQMLDQVLEFFSIIPDHDLAIMQPGQTLFDVTAKGIAGLGPILMKEVPDYIVVQGDTTTAFLGALAGYYQKIPVIHLEAGLRSHDKYSPFPEEGNRVLAGHLADWHFAPTLQAQRNLKAEGITQNVYVVGNTVIDALLLGVTLVAAKETVYKERYAYVKDKKYILVTGHRRESFGKPFEEICAALIKIVTQFPDIHIVYPVHLNPNVKDVVQARLGGHERIHLIDPVAYPDMIYLMQQCYFVLTDSGGVQEEAPALGKPVLVMRDVTEREEGIKAGTAKLVGTSAVVIVREAVRLLVDAKAYQKMAKARNPYGDGTTCKKIVEILNKKAEH